jgi:hypothetical protein
MADIIELYSDYNRKKWFPKTYPDPVGELIDSINEEGIARIHHQSKQERNLGLLRIAIDLSELLPVIRFKDLYKDYSATYEKKLAPAECFPQFTYFHLRKLDTKERAQLWESLQEWAEVSESRFANWHSHRIELAKTFKTLLSEYESAFKFDRDSDLARIDKWIISSKDRFDLDLQEFSESKVLHDTFSAFRLKNWDYVFDWNDFPEIAKSFFSITRIEKTPSLQKSEFDEGVQACLAVFPPRKIIVEYGSAAGPVDFVRFLAEAGKGCFYSNLNPDLPDEFRFAGDPRVSEFWRALFTLACISEAGLQEIAGPLAADLSRKLRQFTFFWLRYDAFLALYRNAAEQDLPTAQDAFVENWRKAFSLEAPSRLYLFELDRSIAALSRVQAMEAALYVQERLRTIYGNSWFSSSQCILKLKDYWWEGFKLGLNDLLEDMNIKREHELIFDFVAGGS